MVQPILRHTHLIQNGYLIVANSNGKIKFHDPMFFEFHVGFE